MDNKTYSFMYEIGYKKPNCDYTSVTYVGGNDEEEAIANATNEAVAFHNKWNDPKITAFDIKITKCEKAGDYNYVRHQLENDRS